jgi:hypothetical protein
MEVVTGFSGMVQNFQRNDFFSERGMSIITISDIEQSTFRVHDCVKRNLLEKTRKNIIKTTSTW